MNKRFFVLFIVSVITFIGLILWMFDTDGSLADLQSSSKEEKRNRNEPIVTGKIENNDVPHSFERITGGSSKEPVTDLGKESSTISLPKLALGSITGRVIDGFGNGVTPAEIVISSQKLRRVVHVDMNGEFSVSKLPSGKYLALVNPESLPYGYVAPFYQNDTAKLLIEKPQGFMATEAIIPPEGGNISVKLRVFNRSTASGIVVDNLGTPLKNIRVRFQNARPGLEKIAFDAISDENGRYCVENIAPGHYLVRVFANRRQEAFTLSVPSPFELEVAEGQSFDMQAIVFGSGTVTLVGKVLDQYEQPFPKLDILVYRNIGERPDWGSVSIQGKTDINGNYSLGPLPAESVIVQIAPTGFLPGRDNNLLKRYVEPIYIDLTGKCGQVRLCDTIANKSEPFTLEGEIHWLKDGGKPPVRVEIVSLDTHEVIRLKLKRGEDRSVQHFKWKVETPHETVQLRIMRDKEVLHSQTIAPYAHGVVSGLVFWIP